MSAPQIQQGSPNSGGARVNHAPEEAPGPADSTGPRRVVLETQQRLSKSKLWEWQAEYFDEVGVNAWAGTVPFCATSSVHIAMSYAQVIVRYLQDIAKQPGVDERRPVYIVELGTGSGQFSYHCVRHLVELCETLQLPVRPCWVMTDFAESNIEFWKGQAMFEPYIDAGYLDMARFDIDRPGALALIHRNREVSHRHPGCAAVCIANHVFDSTRHDVFYVEDGRLHEVPVSLSAPESAVWEGRPVHLAAIECAYDRIPLVSAPYYYDNPLWNELLAGYGAEQGISGSFVFPTSMLLTLDYLEKIGGGKLMLLASDEGYLDTEEIADREPPSLAQHNGCFSLCVNFDAVRRYFRLKGGLSFHQAPGNSLRTCAYIVDSEDPQRYLETGVAIGNVFQFPGPGDFFSVYRYFRDADTFDLHSFVGLLQASGWDPHIISARIEDFHANLAGVDGRMKRTIRLGLQRAESAIYEKPGMKDHYFDLATLYFGLHDYAEAARLYEKSKARSDPTVETCFSIGPCNHLNDEPQKTIDAFTGASELERNGNDAAAWLEQLRDG